MWVKSLSSLLLLLTWQVLHVYTTHTWDYIWKGHEAKEGNTLSFVTEGKICESVTQHICNWIAKRRYGQSGGAIEAENGQSKFPPGCYVGTPTQLWFNHNVDGKGGLCTETNKCLCRKGTSFNPCEWQRHRDGISNRDKGKVLSEIGVKILKTPEENCLSVCLKMKETDPSINGLTRNRDTGYCWCEKYMTSFGPYTDTYDSCLLTPRPPGAENAGKLTRYVMTDGTMRTQFVINKGVKGCSYQGYVPGGKVKSVGEIKAPTATLQLPAWENVFDPKMKFNSNGESMMGGEEGEKFSSTKWAMAKEAMEAGAEWLIKSKLFKEVAPKMGPMMGTLGAMMAITEDLDKVEPEDILAATDRAVEKLVVDINRQILELKGYVLDQVIDDLETDVRDILLHRWRVYRKCGGKPNLWVATLCQGERASDLFADQGKLMKYETEVLNDSPLTDFQFREIEAKIIAFKDWANMYLMVLKGLVEIYQEDWDWARRTEITRKEHHRQFVLWKDEMITMARRMIAYYGKARERLADYYLGVDDFPYRNSGHCLSTLECAPFKKESTCDTTVAKASPFGQYAGMGLCHGKEGTSENVKSTTCTCTLNTASLQVCKVEVKVHQQPEQKGAQVLNGDGRPYTHLGDWMYIDYPTNSDYEAAKLYAKDFMVHETARKLKESQDYPIYSKYWNDNVGVYKDNVWIPALAWAEKQTYKGSYVPSPDRRSDTPSTDSESLDEEDDVGGSGAEGSGSSSDFGSGGGMKPPPKQLQMTPEEKKEDEEMKKKDLEETRIILKRIWKELGLPEGKVTKPGPHKETKK